nr:hypothetical protein [Sedimentibacter sp.]
MPSPYKCRNNESPAEAINGAYPELIYGFYPGNGTNGFDAGIVCRDDGYHLFIADNSTADNSPFVYSWNEHPDGQPLNVSDGSTITLSCYFIDNYCVLEAKSGSAPIKSLSVWMRPTNYSAMLAGCWINREMAMAINEDRDGNTNLTPVAYFKNAKFSNSTMTTTGYAYEKLSNSNSKEYEWADSGFPTPNHYKSVRTTGIVTNGFVADTASATTDSTVYNI